MTYSIIQGNLLPALTATLSYADGTAVNLAGASVNLVLRNPDASAVYLNQPCAATGNTVTYDWASGDTDIPGDYVAEFVVTFSDLTTQSFPTEGYFPVTITPTLTGTIKPQPTYLTTQDVIRATRTYLDGKQRPNRNKLTSALDTSTSTLVFKYDIAAAAQGVPLSIGLETLYVWEQSGKNLTVERGADGTTPSQHAAGDIILVDPEFTDAQILDAINQTLAALPSAGVYGVKTVDLTVDFCAEGYDLATDVEQVLDVRWQHRIDATDWTPMQGFELRRNMPTTSFPSGVALFLHERPWGGDSHTVRVVYRTTLQPLTTLFDDVVTVTGIPTSATDLLSLGAACYLMTGRPIQRVFNLAQPDPRDGTETRVGDVLNAAGRLEQRFAARITDEANKLSRENVYRMPVRRLNAGYVAGFRSRRWLR